MRPAGEPTTRSTEPTRSTETSVGTGATSGAGTTSSTTTDTSLSTDPTGSATMTSETSSSTTPSPSSTRSRSTRSPGTPSTSSRRSTGQTAGGGVAPDLDGERGLPFLRLVRIELRKSVDTRAGSWLLITLAGIVALVSLALAIWGPEADQTFVSFLQAAFLPLTILVPVLGIMSATQEWSQRTGLTTFALEPRRGRVVAAKMVAGAALGLAVLAAAFAGAAVATALAGATWTLDGLSVAGVVLVVVLFTLQGVGFGLALLNTPLAIVATLVLPTVWSILSGLFSWFSDVAPWLDLSTATVPLLEGTLDGEAWGHLVTSTGLWVALPLAVGTWRVLRREIS
ncbi:hypothetical protein GCM10027055_23940 [Janibacter alkaliphilus]|uniref:ABC-2 type transport system permease protein n=1 Tax=Janibacter alkaliphilus TaxID=1069963 RepID=A0A852XIZ0_9MICO|nr:ABC transporter permease [Janibacter alkaliphilus]NYG38301.1 hypothetical protein [Janibacter alkaliphilus]